MGLSCNMSGKTISKYLMPAGKPTNSSNATAVLMKEWAFTGMELGLPMVGTAIATRGFDARPISWHSHDRMELLMMLAGGAAYEFKNGTEMELTGGHMLIVPARILHRGSKDVRTPSVICAVNFDIAHPVTRHSPFTKKEMAWIAAQFQSRKPRMHTMSPTLRRMAHSLHQMILQQRKSPRTADGIASMRLLVASIILEVARHTSGTHQRSTADAVTLAKDHMEAHFTEPLPMSDVAQKAGCSRAHLFLLFKRETGMSPNDWLQRRRIKAATDLLRSTDHKLESIAAACGFSSAQYFCQVFRKYTGKTPGELRQKA